MFGRGYIVAFNTKLVWQGIEVHKNYIWQGVVALKKPMFGMESRHLDKLQVETFKQNLATPEIDTWGWGCYPEINFDSRLPSLLLPFTVHAPLLLQ